MRASPLLLFIKLLVAVAALVYLGSAVEWSRILDATGEARTGWIAAAGLLLAANLGAEAWRWHLIVRHVDPSVKFTDSFGAMMSGFSLGFLTPLRVGDYAGRAFYLHHRNKWEIAALTFAERMLALACYIGFGLPALFYFLLVHLTLAPMAWWVVFTTGVLCGCFLLFFLLHPRATYQALMVLLPSRRLRLQLGFLNRFSEADMVRLLGLSVVKYLIITTQFVFLIWAFAPSFPLLYACTGTALVFYTKSLIPALTLADLGVREGAAVYFLGVLGLPDAAAFNSAILLFGINILLPALLGTPFILRLRLTASMASKKQEKWRTESS